jgi:hypothetical protein
MNQIYVYGIVEHVDTGFYDIGDGYWVEDLYTPLWATFDLAIKGIEKENRTDLTGEINYDNETAYWSDDNGDTIFSIKKYRVATDELQETG